MKAFLRASKRAAGDQDRDLGLSFNRLVRGLVMELLLWLNFL